MDKELLRGEEISSTLFQVIKSSSISQNYASSKFCLDELVKILDCKKNNEQTVYPVFHNVDPFEVEKQTRRYGTALSDHEAEFKDKMRIEQWKTALAEAADLSGWDLRNRDETEVIKEIVQEVLRKLNRKIVQDDLKKLDHGQSGLTDSYIQKASAAFERNLHQHIIHKLELDAISRANSYV